MDGLPLSPPAEPRRAPFTPGLPLIGVAHRMRADPLGTLDEAFRATGDGEAIFLKLGPYHATVFRHPDHVKRVLVDNAANYSKKTRGYVKARLVLGEGLVTSEGALWQRQRRIAMPAFHRQRIAGFADTMVAATEEMIAAWTTAPRSTTGSVQGQIPVRDVFQEMMTLTLHIAVQTLMGVEPGKELDRVSAAVTEVLERTNDIITNPLAPPLWLPLPKYRRFKEALRVLDGFVYSTIAERRGRPAEEGHDLLSMLLAARDEQTGEGMSDRQLRDEAVTILIAGHETTANALAWALWLLGTHPDVQDTLRQEVTTALGDRAATMEDLGRLRLTRAVIEEAMRLYPPAWMIGRYAVADDVVGPFAVRAGEFALVSPYLTHRHPRLWDDPGRFDPSRFLDGRSERLPKFSYLPFGAGPRFCIGANFAMMEAVLILATLARRVRVEPDSAEPKPEPYAMITLRPRRGVRMRVASV